VRWWKQFDATEDIRAKIITAALEALADHPLPEDRPTLLKFLSGELSHVRQTLACLRGFEVIAIESDRQKISPFLSSSVPNVQAAATRALIQTYPDLAGAAADLCEKPSEINVWVLIATALQRGGKQIWSVVEPLLRSESEDIRRIACFYATRVLSATQLRLLLERYQDQHYYYNVVVLLDRALYATMPVKSHFAREDAVYFRKWTNIYHPESGVARLGGSARSEFPIPPQLFG
jgi:HEAT repeat protein